MWNSGVKEAILVNLVASGIGKKNYKEILFGV